jgi:hypothetical protein
MTIRSKGRVVASRRAVLGGSAATLASFALPSIVRAQPTRVRQSITSPNIRPQTIASYKAAVNAMLKLPASDPRNWYRQALVHLLDCPHGNFWFVSWHRGYLLHFEEICRELSGDAEFALPYWDWTREPRIPATMFEDVLDPHNSAYPLADFTQFSRAFQPALAQVFASATPAQRLALQARNYTSADQMIRAIGEQELFSPRSGARGMTAANAALPQDAARAVSIETISDALRRSPFDRFGSEATQNHFGGGRQDPLESQPHNNVHGALGGDTGFMGALLSPVDPIFWLHHANVDRLWDVWTRRQRAAGLPHLPAGADGERWNNEVHPFFVNGQAQPMGDRTTRDYIDNVTLGYTYEPGSGENLVEQTGGAAAASAARGTGIRILATQGAAQSLQVGRAATRTAAIDDELNAILRGSAPSSASDPIKDVFRESGPPTAAAPGSAAASGRLISANVGLALPSRTRKLRFDVFLNASNPSGSTSLTDPHYVGTSYAFGMEHMAGGAAGAHAGHGAHGAAAATHNMAYSLPLGPTIARLQQAGIAVGNSLQVQVVPRAAGRMQESSGSAGALTNVQIEVI